MCYTIVTRRKGDCSMIIRYATSADLKSITCALRNKKINYNTPAQAREDVRQNRLFVIENNGALIAQCALVFDNTRKEYYMKRLCVYNKKRACKGIAQMFIDFFFSLGIASLSATPWDENKVMIHVLEKNGFEFQYRVLENYLYYKKNA